MNKLFIYTYGYQGTWWVLHFDHIWSTLLLNLYLLYMSSTKVLCSYCVTACLLRLLWFQLQLLCWYCLHIGSLMLALFCSLVEFTLLWFHHFSLVVCIVAVGCCTFCCIAISACNTSFSCLVVLHWCCFVFIVGWHSACGLWSLSIVAFACVTVHIYSLESALLLIVSHCIPGCCADVHLFVHFEIIIILYIVMVSALARWGLLQFGYVMLPLCICSSCMLHRYLCTRVGGAVHTCTNAHVCTAANRVLMGLKWEFQLF